MTAETPDSATGLVGATTEQSVVVTKKGPLGWFAAHPVLGYVIRRFGLYLLTLWGAMTLTFFFFRLIPGNPIDAYKQNLEQNYAYNVDVNKEIIDHYNQVFNLDGNTFQQYLSYLYQLIIGHDLGPSLVAYPTPASELIAKAIPWTVGLLLVASIFAWFFGVLLGAVVGWRRTSRFSGSMTYLAAALTHIPAYFIALLAVVAFAYKWEIFPTGHAYGVGVQTGWNFEFIGSVIYHALLPGLATMIVGMFGWMLGMRAQMIMTLGEDYLTFAEAKGLRQGHIMRHYAMRNSYLPQITGLALALGTIFSGNILVEQLFRYPGLGALLVSATGNLDYNLIMGITNLGMFGVLTATFILDLITPLIDPRIRRTR